MRLRQIWPTAFGAVEPATRRTSGKPHGPGLGRSDGDGGFLRARPAWQWGLASGTPASGQVRPEGSDLACSAQLAQDLEAALTVPEDMHGQPLPHETGRASAPRDAGRLRPTWRLRRQR